MKALLPMLFCLFLPIFCFSQTIEAVLFDSLNSRPVADAYIFINQSSIGTVSDKNGNFTLDIGAFENIDLIVSHIAYENLVVPINTKSIQKDTLYLTPNAVLLNEIKLVSKNKRGLRKRRLKKFEDAFLGEKNERNGVYISNPEVLLFFEEEGKLMATSKEPLLIDNDHLGYNLRFFLSEFELMQNLDVFYKGTTSFEEKKVDAKKRARYMRNRKKTFQQTYKRFFHQIINAKLDETDYLVGTSKMNFQRDFVKFQHLNVDSLLVVDNEDGTYEMSLDGYLTVKYLKLKPKRNQKAQKLSTNFSTGLKQIKAEVHDELVSYLGSKTGKIILDSYGRILNPLDVEEYGYWASKRVASMLPLDYSSTSK